jgi:uncharacterized membrane protein YsdA (DUF1294 family)
MQPVLLALVAFFNLLAFGLFGLDKWLARRQRRRIPEAHLLLAALCTGCVGAWLATSVFHHKTRKTSFRVKLLLVTIANLGWIWLYWTLTDHAGTA